MKKIISAALAMLMVLAMTLCFTACGGSKDNSSKPEESSKVEESSAAEESSVQEESSAVEESSAADDEIAVVEFGDYDAMFALSKKIQNLEMDGKTVCIDGTLDKIGSGWSITQKKDAETVGTKIEVEGWSDSDYPKKGTRVKVTGVVKNTGAVAKIYPTPEGMEIIE